MKIVSRPTETPTFYSTDPMRSSYPRKEMAALLLQYNEEIGNDSVALDQAAKLVNEGTICVFTGQQLGFLGGPIYTILKGISCIQQAQKLNAIPIFWLATEDHDVAEIDHTYLVDSLGNLKKYQINFPKDGRFVEDLVLKEKHIQEIAQFFKQLNLEMPVQMTAGSSYSRSMARLLAYLFKGTGLLFIEPYLLRPYAISFIEKELTHAEEILRNVGTAFDFEHGTNIFFKNEHGKRCKIVQNEHGYEVDKEVLSLQQVIAKLHQNPERFSTNVAARPVLQSLLFPTKAYIAGPNEILYYRKLAKHHHFHDVPMPTLIPRIQATFIPESIAINLEKCQLSPWDTLPIHFTESLAKIGLQTDALHKIHNTLLPKNKLQERVLSWWQFQADIKTLINHPLSESAEHLYCYL